MKVIKEFVGLFVGTWLLKLLIEFITQSDMSKVDTMLLALMVPIMFGQSKILQAYEQPVKVIFTKKEPKEESTKES